MKKWYERRLSESYARQGQVYYVYNRVNNIAEMAAQNTGTGSRGDMWLMPMDR